MLKRCLYLTALVALAALTVFAQGNFKPRDADEERAWRLYRQYKASKAIETMLTDARDRTKSDIRDTITGPITIYIDLRDVANLARLRELLKAEQDRQQKLEAAWDRKFSGRYGDLKDSLTEIYDQKTKTKMDNIQFRLTYFPFKPSESKGSDGDYAGNAAGLMSGRIQLTIRGNRVTGTMSGLVSGIPLMDGTVGQREFFVNLENGTLSGNGEIRAELSGASSDSLVSKGTLTGTVKDGQVSGDWTAGWPSVFKAGGTFTAKRR